MLVVIRGVKFKTLQNRTRAVVEDALCCRRGIYGLKKQIYRMSAINSCMEDVLLHQYVKLALAVAIIKRKPKGVTAKSYIDEILDKVQMQDVAWNKKVDEWNKKLLERQQDMMSIFFSKPDMKLGAKSTHSGGGSSSSTKFNVERCMHLLKHVPLQHEGHKLLLKEDATILKSTLVGALEFLTMATKQSKTTLPVPKQMYQACINKLEGLDDCSEMKSKVELMVDSLVKHLLRWTSTAMCEDSEDTRDILLSVGFSPVFRDACVLTLSWHVHEFAASLKSVAKGEEEFSSKVIKYNSICFVLLVLEQILRETSLKNASLETVHSLQNQLNGALLHISQAFPVFAHFLWRLQVLLMQLSPSSKSLEQHSKEHLN